MADRGASGSPDVLVLGGGFAGLAAATALAASGARVLLLEARPYLGGRARSWVDPESGSVVDNGQHLFMGCYEETLLFLDRLGTRDRLGLQPRLELPFVEPGGRLSTFRLPRLPSPWDLAAGLLRFPGLSLAERVGLLRVARDTRRQARRPGGRPHGGAPDGDLDRTTVEQWLASLGQTAEANRRLWHPLAIAALNETPERASAAMLVPVLHRAFERGAAGSRLGLSRVGLSELYAEPAAHFLKARGSEVRLRAQVRRVVCERGRFAWALLADGARLAAGAAVAAVPADDLLEMLPPETAASAPFAGLSRLEVSPIVSAYLWFGSPITDLPFAGLLGGTWQWMFNRRAFGGHGGGGHGGGAHGVTLVKSAARDLVERPIDHLVRKALDDLHAFFPDSRRATLRHSLVIKEKRATLAHAPGTLSLRPGPRTPCQGLYLAGDWTATGLPATIEGAVASGHACALLAREGRPPS